MRHVSEIMHSSREIAPVTGMDELFNEPFNPALVVLYPRVPPARADFNSLGQRLGHGVANIDRKRNEVTRWELQEITRKLSGTEKDAAEYILEDMRTIDSVEGHHDGEIHDGKYITKTRLLVIDTRGLQTSEPSWRSTGCFHRDFVGGQKPKQHILSPYTDPATEGLRKKDILLHTYFGLVVKPWQEPFHYGRCHIWRQTVNGYRHQEIPAHYHRSPVMKPGHPPRLLLSAIVGLKPELVRPGLISQFLSL